MRPSSLSWKILLGIVPVLLIALAVSVFLQNRFQEEEMMDQAQESAHTYAALIRESLVSMMVHSAEVDTMFLVRVRAIRHFDSLAVLVGDLRLREELLTDEQIARFHGKVRPAAVTDTTQQRVLQGGEAVFYRGGDQVRAVIPFNATKVCQKCHAVPVGSTLGAADMRFSLERFADASASNWRRSLIIFLLFAGIGVGLAIVVFRRTVARPVDRLVRATKEIQRGNLAFRAAPEETHRKGPPDELGFLEERFDEMRLSLADKIARLDQANRDLSRRNEELEEALASLRRAQDELMRTERLAATGKMAAQLSHEINNPIHNTQSLLESSLRRLAGNEQARELVEIALGEVTRMASLTRQLLDVYRGSVTDAVVMVPVDLAQVLREIGRAHQRGLAEQGITLTVTIDPQLPHVCGSHDKLKQLFLNLLLNARDAMPQGGEILITATPGQDESVVKVADTGIGIPAEHRDRIFEAFFSTKTAVSGVGLGLAVSYGIVKQHRGSIEVKSDGGKGTTFTVRLPAASPERCHEENSHAS